MSRTFVILIVVLLLIGGLLLLVGGWFVATRNSFVRMDEGVNASWSQVQNQYQRRMDLIPNLVNTVKGVANFEKETYTAVAEARAKAGQTVISAQDARNPAKFAQFEQAQGQLSSALSRLLVAVEKYPELKANQNFTQLQDELAGTENRIAVERKRFNEVVQGYNTKIRLFPASLVAGMTGFSARPYFQAQAGADQAPKVQF
ncbi:LemA family protein [bacterium]|nr:LemA family protein [bacterium]